MVTVRELLTHRSGVPHRVTTALEETQPLQPADIVQRVRARPLLFEPGTKELYSSAGFTCLARVIEVIEESVSTRSSIAASSDRRSMASATAETGQQLMPDRALPYRLSATEGKVVVASAPTRTSHSSPAPARSTRRPRTCSTSFARCAMGHSGRQVRLGSRTPGASPGEGGTGVPRDSRPRSTSIQPRTSPWCC